MAQSLVSSLLLCSIWSALLWLATLWLQRKVPAVRHWPTFYWLTLGLSFLPLLPLPEFGRSWTIPSVLLQDAVFSLQTLTAQPAHPAVNAPLFTLQQIWPLLLSGILAISLWQLARFGRQWRQLQQLIRQAKPLPVSMLLSTQQRTLLPQSFAIRQTSLAVSPFMAGCQRMVLVVPAYIWQLSAAQRDLLCAHELLHLKRRDPQQLLLLRIMVVCCWFMPALRRLERAFINSIELAVDQAVLQQRPGQAALYGQTLLSSLKLSQSGQTPALTAAFIHASADKGFYQQRLTALFQPVPAISVWRRWRLGLLFGGTMLLLQLGSTALSFQQPSPQWQLPLDTIAVSAFYGEKHPLRQNRPHQGIDFAAAKGVVIRASQQGKVLIADDSSLHSNFGRVVLIDHGAGYQTLYAHLNGFKVRSGQMVQAGEPIGTVGDSGKVSGPHLHFEILRHGLQQDPAKYLPLE